jgi:MFS family permease
MTSAAAPKLRPPRPQHPRIAVEAAPLRPVQTPMAYDRPFWLSYTANLLLAAAVSLLFRYADFVTLLGGTEFHLGWIVGLGMVGSLAIRLFLGSWIDRYGARTLWLGSIVLFVATCAAHLAIASHTGVAIYLLRFSYCCATAGFGGASMTFVSSRAPNERVAELVGMLGTGGFIGSVVGTVLGDLLFGSIAITFAQVAWMFLAAALLGLLALPFALTATKGEKVSLRICPLTVEDEPAAGSDQGSGTRGQRSEPKNVRSANRHGPHPDPLPKGEGTVSNEPSLLSLIRRYSPRAILTVGVAMGMGLGLPSTFLRTYATELGVPRIAMFFLVYSIAAVAIRVPTRRWSERFGPRRIIMVGMAIMVVSIAALPLVRTEWQLALPAIGYGCSHAILWPAVVAACSAVFPRRHRGLATVLILAAWDLGLLVASPFAGVVLKYSRQIGLPPYPAMFLSVAGLLGLVGLWYAFVSRESAENGENAPV